MLGSNIYEISINKSAITWGKRYLNIRNGKCISIVTEIIETPLLPFLEHHGLTRPVSAAGPLRTISPHSSRWSPKLIMTTSSATALLKEAETLRSTNPKRAEQLYKQILETTANGVSQADREQSLRDQEQALIKLGELYRDQKLVDFQYV